MLVALPPPSVQACPTLALTIITVELDSEHKANADETGRVQAYGYTRHALRAGRVSRVRIRVSRVRLELWPPAGTLLGSTRVKARARLGSGLGMRSLFGAVGYTRGYTWS